MVLGEGETNYVGGGIGHKNRRFLLATEETHGANMYFVVR